MKNGDVVNETNESSAEKISIKRNNDDIGTNRSLESNSSDDESKETYDDKWSGAKRRRESSPYNAKERRSSSNEAQDHKRSNGT